MAVTDDVPGPAVTKGVWASLTAFGVRTPAQVLAAEADRSVFLIDGILHSGLTLLYGASEVGKSHLVVSFTQAVVQGRDWMGHRVNGGPGSVLILAADPGDVWEYARRIGAVGTDGVGVARPPAPDDAHLWTALADKCHRLDVRMVVVDNLFSWASTKDVNINADVGQALACLDPLMDRGVAALLVHHTPKSNSRTPAGSHSILAKARHAIRLDGPSMTVHGNAVAETVYPIARLDGRITAVGDGSFSASRDAGIPAKKPHRPRPDRDAQQREALVVLSSLPETEWSGRGMAVAIIGKVDRIQTVGQARELVNYMKLSGAVVQADRERLRLAGTA